MTNITTCFVDRSKRDHVTFFLIKWPRNNPAQCLIDSLTSGYQIYLQPSLSFIISKIFYACRFFRKQFPRHPSTDIASKILNGSRTWLLAFQGYFSSIARTCYDQPIYRARDRRAVHQSLAGAAPAYLADDSHCHLLSDAGRRPLRSHSNDIRKLLVPRTHNKLGDRSFSAAGPLLWNDLPPGLWRPGLSFDSFRRSLKTHLFGDWSA